MVQRPREYAVSSPIDMLNSELQLITRHKRCDILGIFLADTRALVSILFSLLYWKLLDRSLMIG